MIALVSLNIYLLTDLEFLHSIMSKILYLGFIYPPPKNFINQKEKTEDAAELKKKSSVN
jgi:hypothetical protein